MKKLLVLFLLVFLVSCNWASNISGNKYNSRSGFISFTDDKFTYISVNIDDRSRTEIHGDYQLSTEYKIPFLLVTYEEKEEKWLALFSGDIIFIYNEDSKVPFFIGITEKPSKLEGLYMDPSIFKATSFLTEDNIRYGVENLGNAYLDKPWVEGQPGLGIHEKISISSNGANSLIISNGYVSYYKPYLYEYNSRIKRIKVNDLDNGYSQYFDIPDSPNPFNVKLDKFSQNVEVELLEVYRGTRWTDTCINFLFIKSF